MSLLSSILVLSASLLMLWKTSSVPPVEVEQSRDGPTDESNVADDDDDDEDGAGGAVFSGTGVLFSVNFVLANTNFFLGIVFPCPTPVTSPTAFVTFRTVVDRYFLMPACTVTFCCFSDANVLIRSFTLVREFVLTNLTVEPVA